MPAVIITMLVILLVAAAIILIVAMGMQGHAREVNPELADAMERTARHLNGDAEPPRGLVAIFDEIDELPAPDLKELPAKFRSLRSARSATSASSATSAASADVPEVAPDDVPGAGSDGSPQQGALPAGSHDAWAVDPMSDTVVHARLPREPGPR